MPIADAVVADVAHTGDGVLIDNASTGHAFCMLYASPARFPTDPAKAALVRWVP